MSADPGILTPNLNSFLASLKGKPVNASVEHLATLLRRRQIWGARRCAIATANLLINVVASYRPKDPDDLLSRVRNVSKRLAEAQPLELTVGNVARRILGLIRDASDSSKQQDKRDEHLAKLVNGGNSKTNDDQASGSDLPSTVKEDVLDGIRELLEELDQADKQISEYSHENVFAEETILFLGGSHAVQRFLLDAARRRKFRVFQVEGYPNEHEAAHDVTSRGTFKDIGDPISPQNRLKTLPAAGIQVTVVPDTQVFAVMPLVSKVILSAQGVFSNGGCILPCGCKSVAAVANFHRVPVLVLSAIYRLSPAFPYDPRKLIEQGDPSANAAFQDGRYLDQIEIPRYIRDYLAPDFVSLFVTNIGGSAPSQMYRLASDHYRSQDVDL